VCVRVRVRVKVKVRVRVRVKVRVRVRVPEEEIRIRVRVKPNLLLGVAARRGGHVVQHQPRQDQRECHVEGEQRGVATDERPDDRVVRDAPG